MTFAQDDGLGGIDTGGFDLGGLGGDGGGFGGDGGGGTDGGTLGGGDLTLGNATEDMRNQGFVGATSADVEGNFVGPSSQTNGDATFGGGVNDSGTQAGAGGGGGGAGGGGGGVNGGFGGQGGAGTQNGFEVIRRSVRARLVPQIDARPIPGDQVVSRFQNRFSRQPGLQRSRQAFSNQPFVNGSASGASSVNVQVENRTAYLTGFAGTWACLLYTSPSPRDKRQSRMPSSA